MAKLTAENWWFLLAAASYKIKDGSAVSLPLPVRWVDQRGSGDMGSSDTPTGLESDAPVTFTLLVDSSEKTALMTAKGTTASCTIVDKSGAVDVNQFVCSCLIETEYSGTVGDNVELSMTLHPQALPTTPDLSHLDTSAA